MLWSDCCRSKSSSMSTCFFMRSRLTRMRRSRSVSSACFLISSSLARRSFSSFVFSSCSFSALRVAMSRSSFSRSRSICTAAADSSSSSSWSRRVSTSSLKRPLARVRSEYFLKSSSLSSRMSSSSSSASFNIFSARSRARLASWASAVRVSTCFLKRSASAWAVIRDRCCSVSLVIASCASLFAFLASFSAFFSLLDRSSTSSW
mmetsp:Transcript_42602/g.107489  ORF Transcript_42602/g.107489 Transcript_42602/m.107489 type:complete len:205 (+) Transcript_42602:1619-2233(+)